MDFTVGIISRNIATTSNFVEFRDSRNFTFFYARRRVWDTWHFMSGSRGAMCPGQNGSNNEPSGDYMRYMASCHWRKIHGRWIRDKVIQMSQ